MIKWKCSIKSQTNEQYELVLSSMVSDFLFAMVNI